MSHNPTAILISNKSVPTITATGGTLINPPYFQFATGYDSVVFDNTILRFDNLIQTLLFLPYNPGVTAMTFNNFQAIGNITVPSFIDVANIVTLSFPDLIYVGTFQWSTFLGGTTLSFPALKYAGFIGFNAVTLNSTVGLTSISFPELLYCTAFQSTQLSSFLTSISFPKLKKVYGAFNFSASAVTTLSFPALTNIGTLTLQQHSAIISLIFPVLVSATNIQIANNAALQSITFTSLVYCTSFAVNTGTSPALTSISFPALTTINSNLPTQSNPVNISTGAAANLSSFSFPNLLSLGTTGVFLISGAALTQATVDAILVKLASLNGTGGTTAFSNRTVTLNGGTSQAPSATGITARNTLIGRGCTVTTN